MLSKGKTARPGRPGNVSLLRTAPVFLPLGCACAVVAGSRLLAVLWERTGAELARVLARDWPFAETEAADGHPAARFLAAYAEGEFLPPEAVQRVPIDWERVGPFDRDVLRTAATIPYGRTVSYKELARTAGHPGASRAAGRALSRNPWPVIVPCHRVVGADGKLVGFGKGLAAKEALLRFEAKVSSEETPRLLNKEAIR